MLNGIGGRTVAEAKQRMDYAEFVSWCRYREKYGSLHLGMRFDRGIARIAAFLGNLWIRKSRFKEVDFSPYDKAIKDSQTPEPNSIEAAFGLLRGISEKNHGE